MPWQKVIEYPTSTEVVYLSKNADEIDGDDDKGKDNSIYVNTKDGKQVNVDVTYAYHMEQTKLPEFFTKFRGRSYKEIEDSIMKNIMYQSVNEITSQYTLMDLVGDKIPEINSKIFTKFREAMEAEGITVETFNLSNVRPDEATKNAIQNVVDAQNALAKAKVEKEQAEVEAEKARIAAEGRAQAQLIEAQAQAEANAKLQESLNELIIQRMWIQKWEGKLPNVMTGNSNGMIFNIPTP